MLIALRNYCYERTPEMGPGMRSRARSLVDQIHHFFEVRILSGELPKGSELPAERAIAEAAGASRRVVRQAMQRLCDEKLVVRRVGSGTRVAWSATTKRARLRSIRDLAKVLPSGIELLETRLTLEPQIAVFASQRAKPKDLLRMRRALDEMRDAADLTTFKKSGYAFHREIVVATRNPLLLALYDLLIIVRETVGWDKFDRVNATPAMRRKQVRQQYEILDAISRRDAERARQLHMEFLTENIVDFR
jgi:DNA-binding FadR family transcriptional regulator